MAVPKTTQTRYMDGSVQRTTQVTPSLHLFFFEKNVYLNFAVRLLETSLCRKQRRKKDVGMGLLV